jgi:hypothetical protein
MSKYLFVFNALDIKKDVPEPEKDKWSSRTNEVNVTVAAETEAQALAHVSKIISREVYELDSITELDASGFRVDKGNY